MERTIKFRAKDLQGNWVYGGITSLSHTHDGKTYIISSVGYEGQEEKEKIELIEVIPETVGQFTGLLDKNGVEIYEDDKLLVPYNFIGTQLVSFIGGKYNISAYNMDKCKVIGNIHEQ